MIVLRTILFLVGVAIVVKVGSSAVRTFVLPRGVPDQISRVVFLVMRWIFNLRAHRAPSYIEADRIMALYAPLSLLSLPLAWISLVLVGYAIMYWALGIAPVSRAVTASGSSLLTLGFSTFGLFPETLLAFSEAAIGLLLIALLIAYLPTMYGAWSRREAAVAALEVRAGSPPSAVELITRFYRLNRLDRLTDLWTDWEIWFIDIEESHTSLAALTFFRSPQPDRSWVTAAGAILDSAALYTSTLDEPNDPQADLCIRAGYISLRRIAAFFRFSYDPDLGPDDPISISREEFDEVVEALENIGVPLKPDKDRAWRDFAGWRVNYDAVLLDLANLTMAPYAPWSSDRGRPVLNGGHGGSEMEKRASIDARS